LSDITNFFSNYMRNLPMVKSKKHLLLKTATLSFGLTVLAPAFLATSASAGERSATQKMDDAAITAQVKTRLLADDQTRTININVDTEAGVVTLRGTVPTEAAKARAEEIAKAVDGVQVVANSLLIGDSSMNPQTATAKTKEAVNEGEHMAGDAWITTKVKSQLLADSDVKGLDINVSTKDGVVTLAGKVPTTAMRDKAISVAQGVKGVKKVDTQALKVSP
jgi:osmotically-inducible protein OsmY